MYNTSNIWPSNLVEELAFRRGILFLGAGVSATAKNNEGKSPDTWESFIKEVKGLVKNVSQEDMNFIDSRLDHQDYLLALQAIFDKCDPGEYSKFLKDHYSRGGYVPSEVHRAIKELDSKIVITTNFDKIYDNFCKEDGYVVWDFESSKSIISSLKSPENLIVKAHGSIDDTEKIIFTSKQYYESREKFPEFYDLLYALFMTHTVVFFGYGLNDPDINLLLQFLHNTASSSCPHYIAKANGTPQQLIKHWKETYNVNIIEYGEDNTKFEEAMLELRDLVIEFRDKRQMP